MELHDAVNYEDELYNFLRGVEGEPNDQNQIYAYAVNGIAHIGIGINLQVHLREKGTDLFFRSLRK